MIVVPIVVGGRRKAEVMVESMCGGELCGSSYERT